MKLGRILLAILCLALTGCGDPPKAGHGVVGLWERKLRNDAGPSPLVVLEIDKDGRYAVHGEGWLGDRGRYVLSGGKLSFKSEVDQRHTRVATVKSVGARTLTLETGIPVPQTEQWTRSDRAPFFTTQTVAGHAVPRGVPRLLMATLVAEVWPWHKDASPTSIDITPLPDGDFEITMDFFSPSSNEEMTVVFTPFKRTQQTHPATAALTRPLGAGVLDLPAVMGKAYGHGQEGPLSRARLESYKGFGPVWSVAAAGRYGLSMNAKTGAIIEADLTDYIARYNADWARAAQALRKAFRPKANRCFECEHLIRSDSNTRSQCVQVGGAWNGDYGYCF